MLCETTLRSHENQLLRLCRVFMVIKTIEKYISNFLSQPLYKNALYLIINSGLAAVLGSLFWIIVARIYSPSEVGLATALISATGLLTTFSKLGFDWSLIRFLPTENDKQGLINTSLTIVGIVTLVLTLLFVSGLRLWSPALLVIQQDFAVFAAFVIFSVVSSLAALQNTAFVGLRSSKYSLYQSVISGLLQLPLPLILISFGMLGIFMSKIVVSVTALIIAIILVRRVVPKYVPIPTISKRIISPMVRFSISNYMSENLDSLPGLLFPLIIVNILTKESNAYFFIAWSIANLLFVIPIGICSSLLAEGVYEPQEFQKHIWRAIKFTFLLVVPATLIIFFFGDKILLLFGKSYSKSSMQILQILALSSIPFAISRVYVTIKRVQLKMVPVLVVYASSAIFSLALSLILLPRMGLRGLGIGWLATQTVIAVVLVIKIIRKRV